MIVKISNKSLIYLITALSVVVWIVAALLPAYISPRADPTPDVTYFGFACFLWGPFALFSLYFIPWLGNIFGIVALSNLSRGEYQKALRNSCTAVALSCTALFITRLPSDENGGTDAVTLGPGVFIWIISLLVIVGGALLVKRNLTAKVDKSRLAKWEKNLDAKTRVRLVGVTIVITAILLAATFIIAANR